MICAALVTAGGIGKRMAAGRPKQYLELDGIPMLVRTLTAFQRQVLIDTIVVTVPPGDEDHCRSMILTQSHLNKMREIVAGGETRQESVYNGLQALLDTDMIAIHDAARPLVSQEVIRETILAAEVSGAAIAGVPVKETVKRAMGGCLETIARHDLWLAHTPQTFRTAVIVEAHITARKDGHVATDDASLVERLGLPVTMVEDSEENIKITNPKDLRLAELLLAARKR